MLLHVHKVSFMKRCVIAELHDIVQQCGPLEEFKNIYSQIPSMKKPDYTDLGHQTLLFR